jgi:hypothetical protein
MTRDFPAFVSAHGARFAHPLSCNGAHDVAKLLRDDAEHVVDGGSLHVHRRSTDRDASRFKPLLEANEFLGERVVTVTLGENVDLRLQPLLVVRIDDAVTDELCDESGSHRLPYAGERGPVR